MTDQQESLKSCARCGKPAPTDCWGNPCIGIRPPHFKRFLAMCSGACATAVDLAIKEAIPHA